MFAKLLSLLHAWPGSKRRASGLHVELYTRQGCHLCETALSHLRAAQSRYDFELSEIDVDTRPELIAAYGDQVPVVALNGKVRFRGVINPLLLDRLLRAEAARHTS
jgi:glutaredoxin